jgi:hypothetical protein
LAKRRSKILIWTKNIQIVKNLAGSFIKNANSVLEGNSLKVSDDIKNTRLSICKSCEFFDLQSQRCYKCGCFMAIKTYLKAEKCPIGKW